jgi:hypothetical protein
LAAASSKRKLKNRFVRLCLLKTETSVIVRECSTEIMTAEDRRTEANPRAAVPAKLSIVVTINPPEGGHKEKRPWGSA